ncbi:MAG: MFS transporter [Balneolaceae bacterium]|nr:MFS transporter [Balneolaceae bacterium]
MKQAPIYSRREPLQKVLLLAGIVLVSLNLRPALASVGPLVGAIRASTGLSNTLLGLLTTLPLIAFGVVSMFTPLFTRRFGLEGTMAGAMGLLTLGLLLRVPEPVGALFGGTLLLGVAIALGNTLLPVIAKRDFPHHTGAVTGLYSSVLGVGAAAGAGLSIPLAEGVGLGWRWSLGSWALLSLAGLLAWLPQLRYRERPTPGRSHRKAMWELGRSRQAWQVALFMGLQSLTFYVVLAWLPELLRDRGMAAGPAGWMLSLSQAMGVLGTLVIPAWAEKLRSQRGMVWVLVAMEGVSLAGLALPEAPMAALWVSLIGFSLGGSFGLALLFIVLRSSNSQRATELSGMAQSAGYLLAAAGPTLFGALHDLTAGWLLPLGFLGVVAVLKTWMGHGAGAPQT